MTNYEFMQAAEKKVAQCWATLMQRYNKVLPSPPVQFTLRGTTAGMHMGATGVINLNMGFVLKNGDDMLNQTVPHEVCHAWLTKIGHPSHVRSEATIRNDAMSRVMGMRRRRSKRSPHGPEFMALLGSLGCDEKMRHNYDTSNIRTKTQHRWAYKCPACGKVYQLSTCRHNKAMRGVVYIHPQCGSVNGRLERVY